MGGGGAHVDPFDIFSSFFGPSFGGIPWCYPYSSVTIFFLLCSFTNVITGFYMLSSQEVVEAAGEEGKGGEKM